MSAPGGKADVIRSIADIALNSVNRRPFPRRLLARQFLHRLQHSVPHPAAVHVAGFQQFVGADEPRVCVG